MTEARRLIPVLLALAVAGGCGNSPLKFWVNAGFWEPDVETKFGKGDNSRRVDLHSDFGLTEDPGALLKFNVSVLDGGSQSRAPARYNFSFWHMGERHSEDIGPGGVDFDGINFSGVVKTRFKATDYCFTGETPQHSAGNKYAGGIFGVHLLNTEVELSDADGDSTTMSKWIPMPVLGVRYEANLASGLTWYALVEGMSLGIFDIDSFDAEFMHLDTGLKLRLGEKAFLSGGYKTWDFRTGLDEDYVKMEMDGATLVFEVRF